MRTGNYRSARLSKTPCREYDKGLKCEYNGKIARNRQKSVVYFAPKTAFLRFMVWERAMQAFESAEVCEMLNWSAATWMHTLWQATVKRIISRKKSSFVIFDLTDLGKRKDADVKELEVLIGQLDPLNTVLSLNENESLQLSARLGCGILIHEIGYAAFARPCNSGLRPCPVVKRPLLSTGAGDHFSSAFCFAWMQRATIESALDFANAADGAFMTFEKHPSRS